jgi:hypothetical protein
MSGGNDLIVFQISSSEKLVQFREIQTWPVESIKVEGAFSLAHAQAART